MGGRKSEEHPSGAPRASEPGRPVNGRPYRRSSAGFARAIRSWGEAVRGEPQASDERRKGGEAPLRVIAAGDVAVVVELGDEISVAVNTRVRALEFLVQHKAVPGVLETVPSFRSLLVYYDPLVIGHDAL